MIKIYTNLSGKHENNKTSKFYLIKPTNLINGFNRKPMSLAFRWGGLDEMNEIGRESSLGSDLMMLTRRLRCFKP